MSDEDFFRSPVTDVAQALIGCTLMLECVGGTIVETEAYHHEDPASHSFRGPTPRNAVMFGPPGRLYVYRSYGLHWCANVVAGPEPGSAVLLRAIEPTAGLPAMLARRGPMPPDRLASGPGRLTQALGITADHNGAPVTLPPFVLLGRTAEPRLLHGPRIGISKAVEQPWRYGLAGSRSLSRPFPAVSAAAEPAAGKASRR